MDINYGCLESCCIQQIVFCTMAAEALNQICKENLCTRDGAEGQDGQPLSAASQGLCQLYCNGRFNHCVAMLIELVEVLCLCGVYASALPPPVLSPR